ncbi:hypothetical protein [Methylobrevis albus]|uniref:General secretion pathway protein N n=1 Tax=Methylobrevis albus TaxID=2793297 RepID=A0A931I218_9HYPH|nr:hypothetical protein [Methylobrevis albus]MBH0237845.1 hypothetical protein [Methylobrevis albus]
MTMPRRLSPFRTVRAAAAAVLVLALLSSLAARAQDTEPAGDGADAADAADLLLLNPLAAFGADDLAGFRDRPLFSPTRRPPPPFVEEVIEEPAYVEPEPEEPMPEPPPNLALVGIVEAGPTAFAVVRDLDAGTVTSLRLGESLGRWRLAAVAADHIRLEDGTESQELRIFVPGEPAPPGAGPGDAFDRPPPGSGWRAPGDSPEDGTVDDDWSEEADQPDPASDW